MTQFFKLITDNWWGGFFLGAYLFGFALHAMYEKLFTKKDEPMKYITEWAAALFWFFPFFYRAITGILAHFNKKKAAEFIGLLLLPALAIAADNKFVDYQLFPIIGVLLALAPLLILRTIIRKSQGKIPHSWYDEDGKRHVNNQKRPITYYWQALLLYVGAQLATIGMCIAIFKHAGS